MGVQCLAASSQRVDQNTLIYVPSYPFTVGMWIYPFGIGATTNPWCANASGSGTNYFVMRQSLSAVQIVARGGGSEAVSGGVGTLIANTWAHVIARFINATNRRISVITSGLTNIATGGQNVTSVTPTGLNGVHVGAMLQGVTPSQFFDGVAAEYWITNTDIQPDAGAITAALAYSLAYNGPFAHPHVAAALQEYRSFRLNITSDDEQLGQNYYGATGAPTTWTQTNTPTLSIHPPLAPAYRTPTSFVRNLPI